MSLKFPEFELDIKAAELRSSGNRVDVEPQVFDLIVLLATNAGRCVTKDEIIDTVWGGDVMNPSGTGRFIADSWFSDEQLPIWARTYLSAGDAEEFARRSKDSSRATP